MYISNASQYVDRLNADRIHVVVHDWVPKSDLQPASTWTADPAAVDEKMGLVYSEQH